MSLWFNFSLVCHGIWTTDSCFFSLMNIGRESLQHVLRELPSSPVPASCCTALLESFRKYYIEFKSDALDGLFVNK
jgi:hypothetical protein